MTIADDVLHRFTRIEYHQMMEAGIFQAKRVELLDGKVLEMSPQNEPHVSVVSNVNRYLHKHLSEEYQLRCQAPIGAGAISEPEPDFAIIRALRNMPEEAPTGALLVIEVSDTTLLRDRRKAYRYAGANVAEYWIIDIVGRTLEQYTQPVGTAYVSQRVVREDEMVTCTILPLPAKSVRELLPFVMGI